MLASGEKVIKDASADTGWSLARGGLKPSDGAEEESLQVAKDLGTAFTVNLTLQPVLDAGALLSA